MQHRLLLAAILAVLTLGACAPAPKTADPKTAAEAPKSGEEPKKEAAAPSLEQLPANLRHDAFEYYGLGRSEAMKVEYTASNLSTPETGTMQPKLSAINGNEATFLIERTGALALQGTEELVLKEDGLYATKVSGAPVNPPQLEMPAKLEVGKSWTTSSELTLPDQRTAKIESTSRVAAMEKVKTKAGEFDSVRIEANGTMNIGGASNRVVMTGWFVKGRGPVKIRVEQTTPDGQKQQATFEAVP